MADGLLVPQNGGLLGGIAPHGFFAPVSRDVLDDLFRKHDALKERILMVSETAASLFQDTLPHFIAGNLGEEARVAKTSVESMFASKGALASLNAASWSKALSLTDVYDFMPQARRSAWNESIRKMEAPDFTPDNVIPTIRDLLMMREQFLSEKVDGIFRGLSGSHLTNRPEGFGKRMIIEYMLSFGSVRSEKSGLILDLRSVIARLTGRDEPTYYANHALISELQKTTGEWHVVDGGALRIRLYKKGTAHLEIHPDISWKLNSILSVLYPMAIPAPLRQRQKQAKGFQTLQRPLPFAVLCYFNEDTRYFPSNVYRVKGQPCPAMDEAIQIMEDLGGELTGKGEFTFPYDYRPVFRALVISGCLPDRVTHQYYPTPQSLAHRLVEVAAIGPADSVLEPSAGQGHVADLLPADRTTCIELSSLHCEILKQKGHQVIHGDFLAIAQELEQRKASFNRIVGNPPFSKGRAELHLNAALRLLPPGGALAMILPASATNWALPGGWIYRFSEIIEDQFEDASVNVVILTAVREPDDQA